MLATEILLIAGVVGVGVLHTIVPDHWLPIALLARQRGWTRSETARAAFQAGVGHVATTLLFGIAVWAIGSVASAKFGVIVDEAASIALVGFGAWIAFGAWREMQAGHRHHHDHPHPHLPGHSHGGGHGHSHGEPWRRDALYSQARGAVVSERHMHWHRHGAGLPHAHWHPHDRAGAHAIGIDDPALAPFHLHPHGTSGRTALLLVLGSSPMVEGIPAFLAASKYGAGELVAMSVAFAASTIVTYVVLSVYAGAGLQRLNLGRFEQYGEVASGVLIAVVGVVFGVLSLH